MTHTESLRRSPGVPSCDSRTERRKDPHALPFLSKAARAAILVGLAILAGRTATSTAAPPAAAHTTYRHEHRLIGFVAATSEHPPAFVVRKYLVGSDGSRRYMGERSSNLNATGVDWLCDLLFGVPEAKEANGPQLTPAQKLKQIENEAIASCCDGVVTTPPCPEFCFANLYVGTDDDGNVTVTSSFVVCDEGDGCPEVDCY